MTHYLTAEQILFIHARLIDETGGEHGLHDMGLLQSAVARPQSAFDGKELYADLFTKAAALMESLVNNHPFIDGNKRTGLAAAVLFLQINGQHLKAPDEKVMALTLAVAQGKVNIQQVIDWLKKHCSAV